MSTDHATSGWFTSSYSGPHNNSCVEARIIAGRIDIRDSKDREAGHLSFGADAWRGFLDRLKR
ncbi:DUF397 domain-containing protein [Saccharopolyspora gregorii]|uniref:DUF397 domain-containing protein n=1 Tax=Saccharopolyspora gregorii TaxID=33914 RepID=UPI0021ACC0A7|nr:DUF397 domain-containing protein [Saccharopolyspora gregorii]